jgi:hypothetical protein
MGFTFESLSAERSFLAAAADFEALLPTALQKLLLHIFFQIDVALHLV